MAVVDLENVHKTYPDGVTALRGVTIQIKPQERVTIVGPSGCGKTTLLRLIAGLDQPTRGAIRLDGRRVDQIPPQERELSLVFQRPALYPFLSVQENMAFALKFQGVTAREIDRRVEETADWLRITPLLKRRPYQLSGGEQQRVALGRALARRPRLILLDEPLSHLDSGLRFEFRRELPLLLQRLSVTMIYVTHDQEEALALGDRVVVLVKGEIQQMDPPQTLYQHPQNRLVASLIGTPPINLLDGQLIRTEEGMVLQNGPCELLLPLCLQSAWSSLVHRDVTMGIRPENVRIQETRCAENCHLEMAVGPMETLGFYQLVSLTRGPWKLLARLTESAHLREPMRVSVGWKPEQTILFDSATGQALSVV